MGQGRAARVRATNQLSYQAIVDGQATLLDPPALMGILSTTWHERAWRPVEATRAVVSGDNRVRGCPDTARDGFKLLTYTCWFRHHQQPVPKGDSWTYYVQCRDHVTALAQFRLGSSWLNIDRQRYGPGRRPRSERVCECCAAHIREDELHVFECTAYADLRLRYHDVVHDIDASAGQVDGNMYSMVNKGHNGRAWRRFAQFIYHTKSIRTRILHPELVDDEHDDTDAVG